MSSERSRLRASLHSLGQLTLVRIREFTREPEAVFWAVFFPVLLTAALGIAFSGGSTEVITVVTTSPEIARAIDHDPGLAVEQLDPVSVQVRPDRLRPGRDHLGGPGQEPLQGQRGKQLQA